MAQQSIIETHPQKQVIIDQLIAGQSLRRIGKSVVPPVGHTVIQDYMNKVVKPAMEAARINRANPTPSTIPSRSDDTNRLQQSLRQSPVRERLESVWSRTKGFVEDTALNVDNGAPILNAATKQIELLAKLTGELQQGDGPAVNIRIVMPGGPEDQPRVDLSGDLESTFDIGGE